MKVGEVIDRLNKKESMTMVAKQLNMKPYALSKKLRILGYEYDSEKKKRVFIGEGEEPRERSIFDNVLLQHPSVSYDELIYNELKRVRELLEQKQSLLLLPDCKEGEKKRRSFMLTEEILQKLDERAQQTGISKAKIVEMALHMFLKQI